MKEKKESNAQAKGKVTIKAGKIIDAYDKINTRGNEQTEKQGFKLSALETKDIFIVLRAINALKPVAEEYKAFQKDARERLKPEEWDDLLKKAQDGFGKMTDEERMRLQRADIEYTRKVNECCDPEREKDREIDAYEHLGEDAFGLLVKDNRHVLDAFDIALLQEILA